MLGVGTVPSRHWQGRDRTEEKAAQACGVETWVWPNKASARVLVPQAKSGQMRDPVTQTVPCALPGRL